MMTLGHANRSIHAGQRSRSLWERAGLWTIVRGTLLVPAMAGLLTGCGPRNIANENDALRAKVLDLEKRIDELTRRNAELESELKTASAAPDSLPEDIRASTPRVAEISFDRLSHAKDTDGNGSPDTLVVYIKAADGWGRHIQLVGTLAIHAAILPPDADAVTIGRVELGPLEVRDAYRSGLTGTHYTLEVPLRFPEHMSSPSCETRATFVDGLTGTELTTTRTIALDK